MRSRRRRASRALWYTSPRLPPVLKNTSLLPPSTTSPAPPLSSLIPTTTRTWKSSMNSLTCVRSPRPPLPPVLASNTPTTPSSSSRLSPCTMIIRDSSLSLPPPLFFSPSDSSPSFVLSLLVLVASFGTLSHAFPRCFFVVCFFVFLLSIHSDSHHHHPLLLLLLFFFCVVLSLCFFVGVGVVDIRSFLLFFFCLYVHIYMYIYVVSSWLSFASPSLLQPRCCVVSSRRRR